MTQLTFNLRDILAKHLGRCVHAPATIDIDELLEFSCDDDQHTVDLAEALAAQRRIAIVWCTDDVREVRPDLTDDQAWEVLQTCRKSHDCNFGLSWGWIEATARNLFGDPDVRVARFQESLAGYGPDTPESCLTDLLADARHWCRANQIDFEVAVGRASAHFVAESKA